MGLLFIYHCHIFGRKDKDKLLFVLSFCLAISKFKAKFALSIETFLLNLSTNLTKNEYPNVFLF